MPEIYQVLPFISLSKTVTPFNSQKAASDLTNKNILPLITILS